MNKTKLNFIVFALFLLFIALIFSSGPTPVLSQMIPEESGSRGNTQIYGVEFNTISSATETQWLNVSSAEYGALQILSASETATGQRYVTEGPLIGASNMWLEGKSGGATSGAAIKYATLIPVAGPIASPTGPLTIYGMYHYDLRGITFVRVCGTVITASQYSVLGAD
jgi:hypothetical protein